MPDARVYVTLQALLSSLAETIKALPEPTVGPTLSSSLLAWILGVLIGLLIVAVISFTVIIAM